MKSYGKKTRILRGKIDTCSNTNIMPASTYKIIYNDLDCIKLQPSKKKGIQTYTKHKIPVIGSCELFVLHSDDTNIPDCARLIYSSVDALGKHQYKVEQSVLRTKISNKKCQEAHRRPQNSIPEGYSRLCSDRTCQYTRCYKINSNPKRQKISYNQSVKSRHDQEVRSPKVTRHMYTNYQRRYQVPV